MTGPKPSPQASRDARRAVLLEALYGAAIDQPSPSPDLKRYLMKLLKLDKHPLVSEQPLPKRVPNGKRPHRKKERASRERPIPIDRRGQLVLADLLSRAGLVEDAQHALAERSA
jgi:hypothetical protein